MLAWGFAMACQAINYAALFRFYTYKCILESQRMYRYLSGGQTGLGSLRLKIMYSKTCLKQPLKKNSKTVFFNTNYRLMQIKGIAECSKGSILQYF